MAFTTQKIKSFNPHKAAAKKARRKKGFPARVAATRGKKKATLRQQTGNPLGASLLIVGPANPHRHGGAMAQKKKKAGNPAHRGGAVAHKTGGKKHGKKKAYNPHGKHKKRTYNPNIGTKAVGTLKAGVFALVGLVVTRQLPQMVLGVRNVGFLGYGANAITAFLASWLIGKFAGADAGNAALIGGGLYTVNRGLQEYLSPVGRILSLQGVGDPMALGEIVYDGRAYYPVPVAWDGNNPVIPNAITDAAARAARAALPAPAAMSGLGYSSRFAPRYRAA